MTLNEAWWAELERLDRVAWPPLTAPALTRFRYAYLDVGYGRGEVDVDLDAPRDVTEWWWMPSHIVARRTTSPWLEVWKP